MFPKARRPFGEAKRSKLTKFIIALGVRQGSSLFFNRSMISKKRPAFSGHQVSKVNSLAVECLDAAAYNGPCILLGSAPSMQVQYLKAC